MTIDIEEILEAVRALPAPKQLQVLQSLAQWLGKSLSPLVEDSADFWIRRTVEELAAEQGASVARDLHDFAMPDWPTDETADDLIAYIRSQRDADRGA